MRRGGGAGARKGAGKGAARAPHSRLRTVIDYAITIAIAVVIAFLVQAFLVKPFKIPTPSMADTVHAGDRVLIDRVSYHFRDIERGDIVVFEGHGPIPLLKRVVGIPGDTLSIRDGALLVNGVPAPTGYIRRENGVALPTQPNPDPTSPYGLSQPYKVPDGRYFMMGDNRTDSLDSRYFGTVARDEILGRAFFVYWPPGQLGRL